MITYNIILSDIPNSEADKNFAEFVQSKKYDWWRYTTLNWILLTPDNVSTNMLIAELVKCYGPIFFVVLEIDIKDFGGIIPGMQSDDLSKLNSPFTWFNKIKSKDFIPAWEKSKTK